MHPVVQALVVVLCALAAIDIWSNAALRTKSYWFHQYTNAVKSGPSFWEMGYKIEDLEISVEWTARQLNAALEKASSMSIIQFRSVPSGLIAESKSEVEIIAHHHNRDIIRNVAVMNESSIYRVRCGEDGPGLRVGANDFMSDPQTSCRIYLGQMSDWRGEHSMFERVELGDETFGLRSIVNHLFVRAVPSEYMPESSPWGLELTSPVPGAAETFRISSEGYLYSSVMGKGKSLCEIEFRNFLKLSMIFQMAFFSAQRSQQLRDIPAWMETSIASL